MSGETIHEMATSYTVAVTPIEDEEGRRRGLSTWDVKVEWTGVPGRWAVRGLGRVYDIDGEEEWEPSPSNREDDFLDRTRFDLPTALAVARKVAPTVVVNGMTAVEAYQRFGSKPRTDARLATCQEECEHCTPEIHHACVLPEGHNEPRLHTCWDGS